ncbi:AraC family transcriptional regulator [Ramlibacter sp. WS9]|uniref:helix-turn-helix domain-containing protein n=1 Tax=Ramlibacter sp. WS9 TaxID=1882741 RepID=UPI00130537FA|nr:AraC family transcriptional regulator [Ramlibacter sp. WS9]
MKRWRQLDSLLLDDPCEALLAQVQRTSAGRPWKGLKVWHQVWGLGDLYVPPARTHCIVLRRSTPTELLQRQGTVTGTARLEPGDAIIVPAETPSFWRSSASRDYVHMDLDPSWLRQAAGHDVRLGSCFGKADPVLAGFAHVLLASLDSDTSLLPAFADTISMGVALHLVENYAKADTINRNLPMLSRREMRVVVEAVASDLEADWSVAELAALLELSPFHFSRAFKRSFGTTPHAYVTAQRMERAASLTRKTSASFSEIAAETGYSSPAHFSQSFRRYWGVTPMTYRKGC